MKAFLLLISVFASNFLFAQNSVGIGTSTPIATLEVLRGTAPFGTAAFHGTNNISHFNIGTSEDTYINGGKPGSHVILNFSGSGLVGIGTLTPFSPLTFNNNLGQKISLFGNSSNNYGFGITAGTFQIHSDAAGADIAFGYGSSASFTERMRIKGNGNVGIGVVNPQHPLDINGRMRLSGTNPNDPGIWLNDANVDRAFIGLQNNNHVGFYGADFGIAWGFTMNTNTGALALNGNEGGAGQVITSNGAASPEWTSPTNSLYNNTQEFFQTSAVNITGFNDVPGLTQSITVPACKVMLIVKGTLSLNNCFNCGPEICRFDIWVDGTIIERYQETGYIDQSLHVTNGAKIQTLTAGTHTIAVKVDGPFSRHWDVSGFKLVIFVIPQ